MKDNTITITPPEGYEIDNVLSTERSIVFKKIEPKTLFSWRDIMQDKFIKGTEQFYVTDTSTINSYEPGEHSRLEIANNNVNTHAQAQKLMYISMIMTVADHYNQGWKPDFRNRKEYKWYPILNKDNEVGMNSVNHVSFALIYFKSEDVLRLAINNNLELFKEYLTII